MNLYVIVSDCAVVSELVRSSSVRKMIDSLFSHQRPDLLEIHELAWSMAFCLVVGLQIGLSCEGHDIFIMAVMTSSPLPFRYSWIVNLY